MNDQTTRRVQRLPGGWRLIADSEIDETLVPDFIRPAIRSIPPGMTRRLGPCRIIVINKLGRASVASRWSETEGGLEVSVAAAGRKEHDITLELLVCLGQALWTKLNRSQRNAYWLLLDNEIGAGVIGEIDEDALKQKRLLLSGWHSASSGRRLELYGAASFAGTAAEYIHSLWHDVTVRSGPGFLPARQLKQRLDLLSRWFPPSRGCRLFPAGTGGRSGAAHFG